MNRRATPRTLEGRAERVRAPYLVLAGEADELCPLSATDRLLRAMRAPRTLVVYRRLPASAGSSTRPER
jgi:alpha-beta hydrolase superfamily lysophospholipase